MKRRHLLIAGLGAASSGLYWAESLPTPFNGLSAADLAAVDPELRARLKSIPDRRVAQFQLRYFVGLSRDRTRPTPLAPPYPQPREVFIESPAASGRLRLLVVDPDPERADKPAILHIHGGGMVAGSPDSHLLHLQRVAHDLGALIIAPDYRLAPENPWPAAVDDLSTALKWLVDTSRVQKINRTKIALHGESAGGGLAALLAVAARDKLKIPICCQALIYPMLDDRTGSTRPAAPGAGKILWGPVENKFAWSAFLGARAGGADVPPGAVPARIDDLSGLPATFIGVGSLDLFCREDREFSERLRKAGVETTFLEIAGAYHGFEQINPQAAVSTRFEEAWKGFLFRHFTD